MSKLFDPFRAWWEADAPLRDKLLAVIGTLAILWYFVAIFCVGSWKDAEGEAAKRTGLRSAEMRQFMVISITTISGTLATYLGLILGITQVRDAQLRASGERGRQAGATDDGPPQVSKLQVVAAWAYVASVVVALLLWAVRSEGEVDAVIVNLGRSCLGLFGGVLAVILNLDARR